MKTDAMRERIIACLREELKAYKFVVAFQNPDTDQTQTIYGDDSFWMLGAIRSMDRDLLDAIAVENLQP